MSYGPGPGQAWFVNVAMSIKDRLDGRQRSSAKREAKLAREARIAKRHSQDAARETSPDPDAAEPHS